LQGTVYNNIYKKIIKIFDSENIKVFGFEDLSSSLYIFINMKFYSKNLYEYIKQSRATIFLSLIIVKMRIDEIAIMNYEL